MFGRGMRAGIDRREQKKQLVSLERDSLRRSRAAAGIEETTETRRQEREREKLADQYDGFDMRVRGDICDWYCIFVTRGLRTLSVCGLPT